MGYDLRKVSMENIHFFTTLLIKATKTKWQSCKIFHCREIEVVVAALIVKFQYKHHPQTSLKVNLEEGIALDIVSVNCLNPGPCYSDKSVCARGAEIPSQTQPQPNSPGDSRGLLDISTALYFYKRLKTSLHKPRGNLLENLTSKKCAFKNSYNF